VDSAYKLCNIKNLVVVSTEHAKTAFLESVYPHNIDCIVVTQQEAKKYKGNFKVMFFSCFVKELSHCENIVMDDIIFSTWSPKPNCVRWEPESLAIFMSNWFSQDRYRKTKNNHTWRFENGKPNDGRFDWLQKIMY
tara:strand:+ start:4261 stop:4668 length:408 start_codon:yes stop_codon:yes gene_type:complete